MLQASLALAAFGVDIRGKRATIALIVAGAILIGL